MFEELLAHLRRVPLVVPRTLGFEVEFDEVRTEALDFSFHFESDIVGSNRCAESLGCGDSFETGDPGADDKHVGRTDGASGGHLQWEHLWKFLGSHQRGLVAAEASHRREGVHALRPANPGDEFQRERAYLTLC